MHSMFRPVSSMAEESFYWALRKKASVLSRIVKLFKE